MAGLLGMGVFSLPQPVSAQQRQVSAPPTPTMHLLTGVPIRPPGVLGAMAPVAAAAPGGVSGGGGNYTAIPRDPSSNSSVPTAPGVPLPLSGLIAVPAQPQPREWQLQLKHLNLGNLQ